MNIEIVTATILLGAVGYLLFFTSFHWIWRLAFGLPGLGLALHYLKLGEDLFEREIRDDL
jgi:hypothetical protein